MCGGTMGMEILTVERWWGQLHTLVTQRRSLTVNR
jgi:hypothetical protein